MAKNGPIGPDGTLNEDDWMSNPYGNYQPWGTTDPTVDSLEGIFTDPSTATPASGGPTMGVGSPEAPQIKQPPSDSQPPNPSTGGASTSGAPTSGAGPGDPVGYLQSLLSGGTSYGDAISKYNSTFNPGADSQAKYYNVNGNNVIGLPGGVGGPYGGYFTDEGGWHFVPRVAAEGGSSGATGGAPASGASTSGASNPDVLGNFLQNLLSSLSSRQDPNSRLRSSLTGKFNDLMGKYSAPVTSDDPIIRSNTDAYHGIQARNLDTYRQMMAERASAEGVPTGAFDSAVGNAAGAEGRDEAQYTGNLMSSELSSRRSALANILQQAGGYLSDQDKLDLQDKISTIDASLREQLGEGALSNQKELGEGALANQKTSINNQNTQFYDSEASGLAGQANSLDAVLLKLLNG